MIPIKNTNAKENNEECISYMQEILPDFQKRTINTIDHVWAVPEDKTSHVGMEEMSAKSRIGKYFVEFASNCSIHGFNHLVARHRHPLERILAAMVILGGLACFIYVSVTSWYRYQYAGFITLWDHHYELMRVVKPAVLICGKNVIDESKFPATFERYGIEDTPKARAFFHFLPYAKYDNMADTPDYEGAPPELWLRILNDVKKEFYYETSLPGTSTWVFTEDGLCISIGSYVLPYSGLEYMLADNWTLSALPSFPPDISDYHTVNKEIDDPNYLPAYVLDRVNVIRETLSLDSEGTIAFLDPLDGYMVQDYQEKITSFGDVEMNPVVTLRNSAKDMDKLSKHRRQCRFPWEEKLELWPIYAFQMCITEYRVGIIKRKCGCYPHFVRRIPGIPICNATQLRCIGNYGDLRATITMDGRQVNFDIPRTNGGQTNITNFTVGIMYPKRTYTLKEQFSFVDLMASIGGAAGLFLGCSVLSFVEIFYYGTLHLYTSKRKYE
ncbi:hypothetical protein KPH14_010510 [Odynerus spinipes]|uniref:Uncharacterized protein n=1 Tax=Odynerus spinipes TaxID=1348599 RepID=A0AAD9RU73_9HYME|nr:hypothetical protein KPH14_010510 [Odynerus spinipes]